MRELARKLKADVAAIALPEGRVVGTAGHQRARRYLLRRMKEMELEPYEGSSLEIPYSRDGEDFVNLVGVVPGRSPAAKPVLIGAHYDSVIPAPCADDNAAAVAIALAAAEILRRQKLPRDVVIAIFDAEEPWHFQGPSMGSIRFYEDHARVRGIHAAVIMDLVGHDVLVPAELLSIFPWFARGLARFLPRVGGDVALPGVRDLLFMTGAESHPSLAGLVDAVRLPSRLRLIAALNQYVGDMSDHGVFRQSGVPYLFLSCGRWRHYHRETDTPEKLNYNKMVRITRYLVALAEALAATKLPPNRGGSVDTVEFEVCRIRRACGPTLPYVLRWLGVEKLETRADITALSDRLLRIGL